MSKKVADLCKSNDQNGLRQLISEYRQEDNEYPLLTRVVNTGDLETVKFYLNTLTPDVLTEEVNGKANASSDGKPLYSALTSGREDIARALLEKGAAVDQNHIKLAKTPEIKKELKTEIVRQHEETVSKFEMTATPEMLETSRIMKQANNNVKQNPLFINMDSDALSDWKKNQFAKEPIGTIRFADESPFPSSSIIIVFVQTKDGPKSAGINVDPQTGALSCGRLAEKGKSFDNVEALMESIRKRQNL